MTSFYCGSCNRLWEQPEEDASGEIKGRRPDDKRRTS